MPRVPKLKLVDRIFKNLKGCNLEKLSIEELQEFKERFESLSGSLLPKKKKEQDKMDKYLFQIETLIDSYEDGIDYSVLR